MGDIYKLTVTIFGPSGNLLIIALNEKKEEKKKRKKEKKNLIPIVLGSPN